MNDVIKTMHHRRSVRNFKKEQILDEQLDMILEAGTYAPNSGSRQSPIFAVCQNAELFG